MIVRRRVGRLLIFLIWGFGLAGACWSLYSFARKTVRLVALERQQADSALRKAVQAALHDHRSLVDDATWDLDEMRRLLDDIAYRRRREVHDREWTDEQLLAIQNRLRALVAKYHLREHDPQAHRRHLIPGVRGRRHVMGEAELRLAFEEIFVQVRAAGGPSEGRPLGCCVPLRAAACRWVPLRAAGCRWVPHRCRTVPHRCR